MTPEEEPLGSEGAATPAKRPGVRRSRRGGRGRGRKPAPKPAQSSDEATAERVEPAGFGALAEPIAEPHPEAPIADSREEETRREEVEGPISQFREEREPEEWRAPAERPERRDFKPASPAAIADAIAEVNHIIASLKQVLDGMEEVLETLELAEVQKSADEREIESLRYALRHVERRGADRGPESRHEPQPQPRREPRRHGRR